MLLFGKAYSKYVCVTTSFIRVWVSHPQLLIINY